jgi:CheY-like chemotaxis protein
VALGRQSGPVSGVGRPNERGSGPRQAVRPRFGRGATERAGEWPSAGSQAPFRARGDCLGDPFLARPACSRLGAGIRITEAETGEAALLAARSLRPDAMVLDLRLPGISGLDAARALRADPDTGLATTPILACSASVQAQVRREALDAGCDAFEGKPFDVRTFVNLLLGLIAPRAAG